MSGSPDPVMRAGRTPRHRVWVRAATLVVAVDIAVSALLVFCRLAVALKGGPPEAAADSLVVVRPAGFGSFLALVLIVPAGLALTAERLVARDFRRALAVAAATAVCLCVTAVIGSWLAFPEGFDVGY